MNKCTYVTFIQKSSLIFFTKVEWKGEENGGASAQQSSQVCPAGVEHFSCRAGFCTPTRRRVGPETIATYEPILSPSGACLYKCDRRFTVFLSYGQLIKPKRGRRSLRNGSDWAFSKLHLALLEINVSTRRRVIDDSIRFDGR